MSFEEGISIDVFDEKKFYIGREVEWLVMYNVLDVRNQRSNEGERAGSECGRYFVHNFWISG